MNEWWKKRVGAQWQPKMGAHGTRLDAFSTGECRQCPRNEPSPPAIKPDNHPAVPFGTEVMSGGCRQPAINPMNQTSSLLQGVAACNRDTGSRLRRAIGMNHDPRLENLRRAPRCGART